MPEPKSLSDSRGWGNHRSVIEDARLGYEAHWEQMLLAYPHLHMTPWDDQDVAVREAWIEAVTPEPPWDFAPEQDTSGGDRESASHA